MNAALPPFGVPGNWYKGVLHIHTTRSDGCVTPRQAMERYRAAGFDFMVYGDHRVITQPKDPRGEMLVIPGVEWDAALPNGPAGYHFFAVDLRHGHKRKLAALADDPQAMAKALGRLSGFLVVAHPYWSALSTEMIASLDGPAAVEVYNHASELEDGLGYSAYVWDQLLARGCRLLAVASDDTHAYADEDVGGGWVMVKAAAKTREAIVAALQQGSYYSTMGPTIESFEITGDRQVQVKCSPVKSVLFRCNGSRGKSMHPAPKGEEIAGASHQIPERSKFVRCEVTDSEGRKAWTNPVYFE